MCQVDVYCLERMNDWENKNANLTKARKRELRKGDILVTYLLHHTWQYERYLRTISLFSLHWNRNTVQMATLISVFMEEESKSE